MRILHGIHTQPCRPTNSEIRTPVVRGWGLKARIQALSGTALPYKVFAVPRNGILYILPDYWRGADVRALMYISLHMGLEIRGLLAPLWF